MGRNEYRTFGQTLHERGVSWVTEQSLDQGLAARILLCQSLVLDPEASDLPSPGSKFAFELAAEF